MFVEKLESNLLLLLSKLKFLLFKPIFDSLFIDVFFAYCTLVCVLTKKIIKANVQFRKRKKAIEFYNFYK